MDDHLTRRAFAAYFRSGGQAQPTSASSGVADAAYFRSGGQAEPTSASSGVEEHDDKQYVVLRNVNGILAVYRVRNDGMLKRLRRWPAAVEGENQ